MWVYLALILLSLIIIRLYYKYGKHFHLIKALIRSFLVSQLKKLLILLEGKPSTKEHKENTIQFNDNHVHLKYHLNGSSYDLRLPFHSKNKLKLHQMILFKRSDNDITLIDITHRHGLPYHLSAKDLGGEKIIHKKGDDIIREFEEEEIPYI